MQCALWFGPSLGHFQLTDEAVEAPKRALDDALAKQALTEDRFTALQPGQVWQLPV